MAKSVKEKKLSAQKRKGTKKGHPKKLEKNVTLETKEKIKKAKSKSRAYNSGKIKTLEDIISENAAAFNMTGKENLNLDQIERMLTQIAIGNAKDGLTGLPPTTKERMDAFKQLCDIKKNKVDESAIDDHNESIRELEFRNKYEDAPDRQIEDLI